MKKKFLHRRGGGPMLLKNSVQIPVNRFQAQRERLAGRGRDHSKPHAFQFTIILPHQTIAGRGCAGVNSYHQLRHGFFWSAGRKGRERLCGHVQVGVHVLDVVQFFQRLDGFHHLSGFLREQLD